MLYFYFIMIILLYLTSISNELSTCYQRFGSNKYDLNQLSQFTILGEDNSFRYAIRPCGLVPTDQCGTNTMPFEQGMTACQERKTTLRFESSMGFLDGYGKTPNLQFIENPQGAGTGVLMIMRNAICNGGERLVNVTFVCDKNVGVPSTMTIAEQPICVFKVTVRAAGACPLGSQSGLSGGAIFIIIIVAIVSVYLLIGVLYNRFRLNHSGLALLPNTSFWTNIFSLFIVGCKFTWGTINTCRHSESASFHKGYNAV